MSFGAKPISWNGLEIARDVLLAESRALAEVAGRLGPNFVHAVDLIAAAQGHVAVTGVGKSAEVGRKIAGTLNSTGTRAYFLDATAAAHGDLGVLRRDDVVLALSHSGASDEVVRLMPSFHQLAGAIVAFTGLAQSPLAAAADVAIVYGPVEEACPLALAPSTSTTVMLALGDALAFSLSARRGFSRRDFARFHPAGSLGRQLAPVEDYMRTGRDLRLARDHESIRNVLIRSRRRGRRTGAVMLLDDGGRLSGIFTDSDLARLCERGDVQFDRPIREMMTRDPWAVPVGSRLGEALEIFQKNKISELPVLDDDGRPVGLLDITDLLAFLPAENGWNETPVELPHAA